MHVVLVHPQIAPNTGNIIRLCANTGATLHLVRPLGFTLSDRLLKRGGLDYHEFADIRLHDSWDEYRRANGAIGQTYAFTSGATRRYDDVPYHEDDTLVFGAEQPGLPPEVLSQIAPDCQLFLPMRPKNRSLNLANAVSIAVYEAWRQRGFAGSVPAAPPIERISDQSANERPAD